MKDIILKDYQNGFDFIRTWMRACPRITEAALGQLIADAYVIFSDLHISDALERADWLMSERKNLSPLKFLDKIRMEFCF